MTTLYIDVSHHDRNRRGAPLDWAAIREASSPVMCARATYGDPSGWNRDSPYFGEFQDGAREARFVARGGYHNLIHGDAASIGRQVDWLRRTLDSQGCNWAMADVEPYAELVTADLWPRWSDVQRFHDVWHSRESRVLAWYIPRWYWSWRDKLASLGEPDLRYLKGPLIQSHYAGGDGDAWQIYANAGGDSGTGWDDEYGGRLPEIWQFTSDGNVSGASDRTDVNAFRGSIEQLTALLTGDDDMSFSEVDTYGVDADGVRRSYGQELRDIFFAINGDSPRDNDGKPVTEPAWIVANGKAILAAVEKLSQPTPAPVDVAALAEALTPHIAAIVRAELDKTKLGTASA